MTMKKLVIILVLVAVLATISVSFYFWYNRPREFNATVIDVVDGDKIIVKYDDKKEKIRLSDIDAPEKEQLNGRWARDYVKMFTRSREVTIKHRGRHVPGGYLLGDVVLEDGASLNEMMVKEGVAWWYSLKSNNKRYEELEKEAKSRKKGLWLQKEPEPPWVWRKKHGKNGW